MKYALIGCGRIAVNHIKAVVNNGLDLVAVCDLAARMIFAPYELPAGILMSFLGGPFFIWLLLRRKEHQP